MTLIGQSFESNLSRHGLASHQSTARPRGSLHGVRRRPDSGEASFCQDFAGPATFVLVSGLVAIRLAPGRDIQRQRGKHRRWTAIDQEEGEHR
jgi:hypothetical protein